MNVIAGMLVLLAVNDELAGHHQLNDQKFPGSQMHDHGLAAAGDLVNSLVLEPPDKILRFLAKDKGIMDDHIRKFLPRRDLLRSRTMVSTSGSSGIL